MERERNAFWGNKSHKIGSIGKVDPYAALAAGVVVHASKEAQEGDLGAAEWLAGDFCGVFCDVIGLDHIAIQRTAESWMETPAGKLVVRILV